MIILYIKVRNMYTDMFRDLPRLHVNRDIRIGRLCPKGVRRCGMDNYHYENQKPSYKREKIVQTGIKPWLWFKMGLPGPVCEHHVVNVEQL